MWKMLENAKRRREKSGREAKTQCRYRSELIIIWGVWTGLSRDCLEAPPWVMAARRWVNCPFAVAGRTTIGPWQWSEYAFGGKSSENQSTHDKKFHHSCYICNSLSRDSLLHPSRITRFSFRSVSRSFSFSFLALFVHETNRSTQGRLRRTDAPFQHITDASSSLDFRPQFVN